VAGIASPPVNCLRVEGAAPVEAGLTLHWQGKVERARLIIRVAGTEAAHNIRVNGHTVAQAPVVPEGSDCGEGRSFYLDVPLSVVKQGENHLELTSDALPSDAWVASGVRLEVLGELQLPQRADADSPGSASTLGTPFTTSFSNSYDGTNQQARVQPPDSPITPTPLVIYLHGRYGSMHDGEDYLGSAANAKGWLLASPEMHGAWPTPPSPPGAFAYASVQAQYDVIGTIQRVRELYPSVDVNRIYLVGESMGGQTAAVTAAKFPDVFAAVFDSVGPTNMTTWYSEQVAFYRSPDVDQVMWMRRECHIGGIEKTPADNPFCYQRRSGLSFAGNLIHMPISITHHISDTVVPISHSFQLQDAINAAGPDQPVTVGVDTRSSGCNFGPYYHSCSPDPTAVLNYFQGFARNSLPYRVLATTDESKSFYWLNIDQLGNDRWTQVQATYNPATLTVQVSVSDTQPVGLGFNLGLTPMINAVGLSQPGLGLTAKTYRVQISGDPAFYRPYAGGYLTVSVPAGQPLTLSISALAESVYLPLISRAP
jgi:pimeloyl-ACP methyl ester carboxylesterase